MSRAKLRDLWAQELGDPPPRSLGRDILALAVAYARQERMHGGLTRAVTREVDRLFDRALRDDLREKPGKPASPLPRTGTVLVREWEGTTHHVTITPGGFLWNGQTHRSLSRIARAITGTAWNGPRFFGLRDDKRSEPNHGSQ